MLLETKTRVVVTPLNTQHPLPAANKSHKAAADGSKVGNKCEIFFVWNKSQRFFRVTFPAQVLMRDEGLEWDVFDRCKWAELSQVLTIKTLK